MTYKEVVDRIQKAVNDHLMLADFGYGQLSDIKVLDADGDGANYPYAFLNAAGVSRNNQATTYSFNLIMMEMALTPSDILQVQSDCIQYLNDIISELRFDSTFSGDVLLTNSIQVFRERFQDEVAGATASFNIVVADPINNCDAPFGVWQLRSTSTYTSETFDFNADANTTGSLCNLQPSELKYEFDLVFDGDAALASEEYKYLTVYETSIDEETGNLVYNILARLPLEFPASGTQISWSPTFQLDCNANELVGSQNLHWAWGATQEENQPPTTGITATGTVKLYYKQ